MTVPAALCMLRFGCCKEAAGSLLESLILKCGSLCVYAPAAETAAETAAAAAATNTALLPILLLQART
jgi:hypothetical protein